MASQSQTMTYPPVDDKPLIQGKPRVIDNAPRLPQKQPTDGGGRRSNTFDNNAYKVDMTPDPSSGKSKGVNGGRFHDLSADSDQMGGAVPDPMRKQKPRHQQSKNKSVSSEGSVNVSYTGSMTGSGDLGFPGMSPEHYQKPQISYPNPTYDVPKTEKDPRRRHKNGDGRPDRPVEPIMAPLVLPKGAKSAQQNLHLVIKAQPGTAVHITPSSTPPHSRSSYAPRHPASLNVSQSDETEI